MNGSDYKAKVLRGGGFGRFDTCRMGISVGQPYHEGPKLQAAFEWAAPRFNRIVVSMADTLQRHNIGEPMAYALAREAGDAWLERNAGIIAMYQPTIQRWDEWISHPLYRTARNHVGAMYNSNAGFREDINRAALAFQEKRGTPVEKSKNYLLEETAVFAIQQQCEPAADVYPGTMDIWQRFKTDPTPDALQGLRARHFTRIGFERRL